MEAEQPPEGYEEVDAVPVLADVRVPQVRASAAVAATSFAAGVATVAVVRGAKAMRARRQARAKSQLAPVLATRSFLIDVHLLGSRD